MLGDVPSLPRRIASELNSKLRSPETAAFVAGLESGLTRRRREKKMKSGAFRGVHVVVYRGFVADNVAKVRVRVMESPELPGDSRIPYWEVAQSNLNRHAALAIEELVLQGTAVGAGEIQCALEQELVAALALQQFLEPQALALQRIAGAAMQGARCPQLGLGRAGGRGEPLDLGRLVRQSRAQGGDRVLLPALLERRLVQCLFQAADLLRRGLALPVGEENGLAVPLQGALRDAQRRLGLPDMQAVRLQQGLHGGQPAERGLEPEFEKTPLGVGEPLFRVALRLRTGRIRRG
jgi:hypothetical protein